jgi:hypothetical protein
VAFGNIIARWQNYGVVVAVGECVDNLLRWVQEDDAVPGIAQSVAYTAICHEYYVAAEAGKVGEKVSSGGDHGETTRGQSQGGDRVSLKIVADSPTSQIDCLSCAV